MEPSWTVDDEGWLSVGHESKCISMAISRLPFVASNNDLALFLLAPVTLTNSAIESDHFSAILNTNWPRKNRGKKTAGGLGLASPREYSNSHIFEMICFRNSYLCMISKALYWHLDLIGKNFQHLII